MNLSFKLFSIASAALLVSACNMMPNQSGSRCQSSAPCGQQNASNIVVQPAQAAPSRVVKKETQVIDVMPRDPIIVRTTGYSAPTTNKSFSKAQQRLMTMRGSKLDAYRNLAERVYGIDISSNNSVSNMIAQHDEIRAYVDAYLVGAKIVSQRELADGTFETVVELALKENFRQCVSSVQAMRSDPNCLMNNHYSTSASVPKPERPSSFYSVQ